jgi:hypothetical protein
MAVDQSVHVIQVFLKVHQVVQIIILQGVTIMKALVVEQVLVEMVEMDLTSPGQVEMVG